MKLVFLRFVILALLCQGSVYSQNPESSNLGSISNCDIINSGLSKEINDYCKADNMNCKSAEDFFIRARAESNIGLLDAATKDIKKSIELDKNKSGYYIILANLNVGQRDFEEAIKNYDKAISLNKSSILAYRGRSLAKAYSNDLDGAMDDINFTLSIIPNDCQAIHRRAYIKLLRHDYIGSREDCLKIIKTSPAKEFIYCLLGIIEGIQGKPKERDDYFTKALSVNPKDPEIYDAISYGYSFFAAPNDRNGLKAVQYSLEACKLSNWSPEYINNLAIAYAYNGDFKNAIKWQKLYIDKFPKDKLANKQLQLFENHKPYHE